MATRQRGAGRFDRRRDSELRPARQHEVLVKPRRTTADAFERVRDVGLMLPHVEAATKYDGSPVLKAGGSFMAGLATHESAEADTLVVRIEPDVRELFLEDAPETYYLTDHYQPHPVVLVRLSRLDGQKLRDLLAMSWRLTIARTRHVDKSSTYDSSS